MKKVDFYDYIITENGDVYSKNGKLRKPVLKQDRYMMGFSLPNGRRTYPLARIIYKAFNDDFDISDKNQCITFKDNNKLNIHLDNLICVFRGDLIQGDGHRNITKISGEIAEQIKKEYAETLNNRPVNQYTRSGQYNSYRSLAKKYGVASTLIKQIVEGKTRNKANYKLSKNKRQEKMHE